MEEPAAVVNEAVAAPAAAGVADFETFFEAESPRLFRALRLLTGSDHEAEELAQESFFKIWERWERVARMENPTGYLYRTAMNGHRSSARRARRIVKRAGGLAAADDPFVAIEARDTFLRWLAELTPRQRAAVILTELVGQDTETAASTLRVKPGTVHVLVSQARATLRRTMETDDG